MLISPLLDGNFHDGWLDASPGHRNCAQRRQPEDQAMNISQSLTSATELARRNGVRFPNESDEYRQARDALLAEEIELRRHIEQVAEQRRALPPGGAVTGDYRFEGEDRLVSFADLFRGSETLVVYSYMYGRNV